MKKHLTPLAFWLIFLLLGSCTPQPDKNKDILKKITDNRTLLPNGWALTPPAKSLPLGDLPLNLVRSSSGKYLAVTNNGYGKQSIMLFSGTDKITLLDEITIPKAWYGLKFTKDENNLYASGGNENIIRRYIISDNALSLADSIILGEPWPNKICPTGIEIDDGSNRLFTVTKEDSALYVINLEDKSIESTIKLPAEAYSCLLNPAKKELYISLWGSEQIAVYSLNTHKISTFIKVESHPNAMVLAKNGAFLFVANANSNSVSVIDLQHQEVLEQISTSLYPDAPAGSTPNGLALSEDESTLYIANADNNCLAVFDVSSPGHSKSRGFIPTGWYPTSVLVHHNKLLIVNGKGEHSKANAKGPNPYIKKSASTEYIGGYFTGTMSILPIPGEQQMAAYSQAVYDNTPYNKEVELTAKGEAGNPIPMKKGEKSPIKYVFYIIKENRTYDQVFGDITQGNGDSTLCLFPALVSPNHHKLAKEFVLFDNFYVDAEVSADGHNWSTAAYATDFTEKTWPTYYGGRGGNYDFEGNRPIAFPKDGYIWDYCQRAGISFRSYGEFVWKGGYTGLESLKGNIDVDYPGFDMDIMDTLRVSRWKHDFDSLIAIDQVPRFSTLRLSSDHTNGAHVGSPTPRAYVADNDLALGRFVEYLSKSKIWSESAIFVVEDDAQNGPDHVDAHRSVLLVVSPYTRREYVDHTMYSTSSVLRTMELILGLPPMSQYDAAAISLYQSFTNEPDLSAYTALDNTYPLDEINVDHNSLAEITDQFNLSIEDAAPDIAFNEIIWKTVKGVNSEMPAPRRGAFLKPITSDNDD